MKIYSIKNESTGFFNRPMFVESEAEVISLIQNNVASDPSKALLNMSESLSLYYCGEIDFETFHILQPRKGDMKKIACISDLVKHIKFKEVIYKDVDDSNSCS